MLDTPIAVKIQGLTKRFLVGDFHLEVLRGIDLEVRKGEILMITGPSGCGKTTLLSIIAGTLRFDEGKLTVFNKDLKNLSDDQMTEFRKSHIGFIFQQFHLIKSLNNLENISIPLLLNGMDKHEAMQKAMDMLDIVGLKNKEDLRSYHLSGGEQQRVAIARALVHQPPLLICDEPTAALDADNGARIMQLIREVAKSPHRSVVVVTHDNRIFKYADRIARMEDGLITGYGSDYK